MANSKALLPKDSYNFIFICMVWIGITTLLPWNMFVAVHEFWMYKFRTIEPTEEIQSLQNETVLNKTFNDIQLNWGSFLSIFSMIPYIIGILFSIIYGQRVPIIPRLNSSIVVMVAFLVITVIFAKVNTDAWQFTFLITILVIVMILNSAMSILHGCMARVAAGLPSNYMNGFSQGIALGGIIACSVNIGILVVGADHIMAAFISFILTTIFTVICGALIVIMTKTEFYKFYHSEHRPEDKDSDVYDKMIERTPVLDNNYNEIIFIYKKIWPWILAIFIDFFVSISVFPPLASLVSSSVEPQNSTEWHTKYFTPIGCFLLFNVGDYIGRFLAGWIQWPNATSFGSYITLIISIIRIIYIPMFMLCNIQPGNRTFTNVYIKSDLAFLIMIITFSISAGYIGSICMMFGPKMLTVHRDQMKAGEIIIASMVSGSTIGAGLSNLWLVLL